MHIEVRHDLPPESRGLRALIFGLGATAILLARFFPFERMPPICSFRLATGHPCLGCGMTRSWVHFAHGRVTEAFLQSPLGAMLFVGLLGILCYVALRSFSKMPALRLRIETLWVAILGGAAVLAVAAHWLYLEVSGVAL